LLPNPQNPATVTNLSSKPRPRIDLLFMRFVLIAALMVQFGSVPTAFAWILLKLRRPAIRLLGGMIRE